MIMPGQIKNRLALLMILALLTGFYGCRNTPVPKPRGYFRIDLPSKEYTVFGGGEEDLKMPLKF